MLLKVTPYGDPLLRRQSERIDVVDETILRLIADMFDTLKATHGIGLSAPQVGVSKQLLIIDWDAIVKDESMKAYLNPEILELGGANVSKEEGCLSLPKIFAKVTRPDKVKVRYTTVEGEVVEETLKDLPARVLQHEFDHLQGVLLIDRVTADVRKGLKPALQAILDGRVVPFDPDKPETMVKEKNGAI
ncbi:MAG: peptide deformylase [Calditrichaeota bacterium]|nr:peptide deformylase [Calditrichota bacterium]